MLQYTVDGLKIRIWPVLFQDGATPKDLAQKAGHMTLVRLLSGPDTYQQNLDAGLGGQVSIAMYNAPHIHVLDCTYMLMKTQSSTQSD